MKERWARGKRRRRRRSCEDEEEKSKLNLNLPLLPLLLLLLLPCLPLLKVVRPCLPFPLPTAKIGVELREEKGRRNEVEDGGLPPFLALVKWKSEGGPSAISLSAAVEGLPP